jgi:hypothetical protein
MTLRRVLAAATGAALLGMLLQAPAEAAPPVVTKVVKVKSSVGYPLTVGQYDKVKVIANAGMTFRRIAQVCYSFESSPADPLSYNDTMALTTLRNLHLVTVSNYDLWQPVNTYCDGYWDGKWLDGKEVMWLWGGRAYDYDNGAATFTKITIYITGVPAM